MAEKVAAASGAWSAAATWNSVTNTPTMHLTTNITVNTTGVFSATFTAPDLVSAVTGIVLFIPVQTVTPATLTATLQESAVDTAAVVTLTLSNINIATGLHTADGVLVYLRLPTPYVFTTLTAGAYRWKLTVNTGTLLVAANSAGTAFAYRSTDDRTGVPASTDDALIVGQNGTTAITVTMDGSQTAGSGTYVEGGVEELSERVVGYAVAIGEDGILAWDTAASATLTLAGNFLVSPNGTWRMGTVASPYPTGKVAKLTFNVGGVAAKFGFKVTEGAIVEVQGLPKSSTTLWKTKLSSGVGTAASPLVTADAVDWLVDDEIIIVPTSNNATNYNEQERRFIKTKNSVSSYVLSSTIGGAEAAFIHTHSTDAWIVNLTRNIIIDSTSASFGTFGQFLGPVSGQIGSVDIDWVRYNVNDAKSTGRAQRGIFLSNVALNIGLDYFVIDNILTNGRGFSIRSNRSGQTFTGLVVVDNNSSSNGSFFLEGTKRQQFIDCFTIDIASGTHGWRLENIIGVIFTRCYGFASSSTANTRGIWFITNSFECTFIQCESHANRFSGLVLNAGSSGLVFNSCEFGTKGTNANDVSIVTDQFFEAVFQNCKFGSATLVDNYLNLAAGSELKFHKYQQTENNHLWYTPDGINRSTGAGLVDTTVRTAGTLNLRLAPENVSPGDIWEFNVLARVSSIVSASGFITKNAAFAGDGAASVVVELFLPGSTVADYSQTMPNNTSTNPFTVFASYTSTVPALATVRITAKSATAAAYAYVADIFNGTNDITNLKTWHEGKPAQIMFEQLGDAQAVWAVLKSTQTTVGTMGYEITGDLDDIQTRLQTIDDFLDTEIAAILAAVDTEVAAIKAKTDNLPTDPADESSIQASLATIAAYIDTEVGAIKAKTDSLTFTVAGHVDANTLLIEGGDATNQINAEMVDALAVDTYAESSGVPAATASIERKIAWLATLARNKITQTATTQNLRNDGDSGNVGSAGVSDDGATAVRGKWS